MTRKHFTSLLVLCFAFVAAACGSSDDDSDPKGGSGSLKCTITNNGHLTYCYEFGSGYTESNTGALCDVDQGKVAMGARVSSCPEGQIVGTCTYTSSSGGTKYEYTQRSYASSSMTCEAARQQCEASDTATNGLVHGAFEGNTCGSGAGAYGTVQVPEPTEAPSTKVAARCVLSSGDVSNDLPCTVTLMQLGSLGGDPMLVIETTDSGHAFSVEIDTIAATTDSYSNDGSRRAVATGRDGSHEWQMFDAFKGEPDTGSYTLDITEVMDGASSITGTVWLVHGSLDVGLEPFLLSGATGELAAHIDF